jgi:hypothetical protein
MNPLCSTCQAELPSNHEGPCPACGGTNKTFRVAVSDTITLTDSLDMEHVHQYYQKNHRALVAGVAFAFGSSCLGLFLQGWVGLLIGLAIGLLALWVVPSFRTKVVEKTRSHYE